MMNIRISMDSTINVLYVAYLIHKAKFERGKNNEFSYNYPALTGGNSYLRKVPVEGSFFPTVGCCVMLDGYTLSRFLDKHLVKENRWLNGLMIVFGSMITFLKRLGRRFLSPSC